MYKKFKIVEIPDQIISRFQDNVEQAISLLPSTEIIQGRLIKNINLVASTPNQIDHKLGRNVVGWVITRQKSSSIIWDEQDSNPNQKLTLTLNCSANVVIDLWIF